MFGIIERRAAINPARYFGAVLMRNAFGGLVNWGQFPAYWIGEFAGGVAGALAFVGIVSGATS
jgi:glycerol uptake facilitator protein